jgi:hypothetical protein
VSTRADCVTRAGAVARRDCVHAGEDYVELLGADMALPFKCSSSFFSLGASHLSSAYVFWALSVAGTGKRNAVPTSRPSTSPCAAPRED